jgi:hypothetical protein
VLSSSHLCVSSNIGSESVGVVVPDSVSSVPDDVPESVVPESPVSVDPLSVPVSVVPLSAPVSVVPLSAPVSVVAASSYARALSFMQKRVIEERIILFMINWCGYK